MDELLKDAIADAKAVRETALANAKLALEEAFTPRLKSMLSKKIQSEMEDAVDELEIDELEDEDEKDDDMEERDMDKDMSRDDDEDMEDKDEVHDKEDDDDMEERGMDMSRDDDEMGDDDMDDDDDEEMEDEGVIEINGVKYAPISETEEVEEAEEVDEIDDKDDKEDDMDEDLDLDEILKELEEVDEAEEVEEAEEVDEAEEVEEDVDLEEVIKALTEDEVSESAEEVETLKGDLKEHRKVVKYLREKLNEVNLLNAKLLFTNKLFRAFGMNNEQKMKVVETFDRAKTLREIKLVYATVAENFSNENIKPIKEHKGSASKAVASTKSEKQEEIISEGSDVKARFQKLANIL